MREDAPFCVRRTFVTDLSKLYFPSFVILKVLKGLNRLRTRDRVFMNYLD